LAETNNGGENTSTIEQSMPSNEEARDEPNVGAGSSENGRADQHPA